MGTVALSPFGLSPFVKYTTRPPRWSKIARVSPSHAAEYGSWYWPGPFPSDPTDPNGRPSESNRVTSLLPLSTTANRPSGCTATPRSLAKRWRGVGPAIAPASSSRHFGAVSAGEGGGGVRSHAAISAAAHKK